MKSESPKPLMSKICARAILGVGHRDGAVKIREIFAAKSAVKNPVHPLNDLIEARNTLLHPCERYTCQSTITAESVDALRLGD